LGFVNNMMYYIHGYQSSPDGEKAMLFKEKLDAIAIEYRTCPPQDLIISDCLKRISNVLKNDVDVDLIGSSLGGFLAASTALQNPHVKNLVLLNPAIIPPSTNLDSIQSVPRKILEDMIDTRLFEKKITAEIMILRGTNDEVVPSNWIIQFAMAQESVVKFFHDDHRLSKTLPKLPQIISKIMNQ